MVQNSAIGTAYIVTSFPPTQRETTKEVCNNDSNACVNLEIMGYSHMTGIVR
jgi:hypothetical protein